MFWVWKHFFGIQRTHFCKIYVFLAISGWFRPPMKSRKVKKSPKNVKKCDFSEIDILLCSGRKCDIWPENDPLGPGKPSETLYWSSYTMWSKFTKNQKNRIFDFKNHMKIFFMADYAGRCSPATKSIWGINRPYWCPKGPIVLSHTPHPFTSKSDFEIPLKFQKTHFFSVFA